MLSSWSLICIKCSDVEVRHLFLPVASHVCDNVASLTQLKYKVCLDSFSAEHLFYKRKLVNSSKLTFNLFISITQPVSTLQHTRVLGTKWWLKTNTNTGSVHHVLVFIVIIVTCADSSLNTEGLCCFSFISIKSEICFFILFPINDQTGLSGRENCGKRKE